MIVADTAVLVSVRWAGTSAVDEGLAALVKLLVGCKDHAPFAGGQQLRRLHAEGAKRAQASRTQPFPLRAVSMSAVLDYQ